MALVVNFGAASLEVERLPNFVRDKGVEFVWETRPVAEEALYPELTNHLFEAMHRVHFELGPGFLHQVYRRATMIELHHQDLSYQYIKQLPITYQGHHLGTQAVRLIAAANKVLLATVAVKQIDEVMKARLKARLKQVGFQLGLLANFNETTLDVAMVRTASR